MLVVCGSKHSAHPKATVDRGIIPPLIALVSSTNMDICSQAIWAVGNLCGDGHVIRDLVVDQGFLPALISAIERFSDKPPFLKTASWALANLCRAKPRPSVSLFMPTAGTSAGVFPTLIALFHSNNNDVISNAAWFQENYFQLVILLSVGRYHICAAPIGLLTQYFLQGWFLY